VNTITRIWQALGNIYLTMGIMGFMVLDLVVGFFMLKEYNDIFFPINDLGFVKWAATWGRESPGATAWLFILVGLLALLSLNTFVCTTDRVIALWQRRRHFSSPLGFVLRFGPHIMHYSMLIIFFGYLFSYLFSGTFLGRVLLPGHSIRVQGVQIELERLDIAYHGADQPYRLAKKARDIQAILQFRAKGKTRTARISFNRPARFRGLSVHLKDFSPKTASNSMDRPRYISLIIKQDPGMGFYFIGMLLFTLGLFIYTWDKIFPTGIRHRTKIKKIMPTGSGRRN